MLGGPYAYLTIALHQIVNFQKNQNQGQKTNQLLDFGFQLFLSNGVYYVILQVQLNCISEEF